MGPVIYWGNVLRTARKRKNLTQKEVAALLHITRQCYSGYETGRLHPTPEIITALSELYDYDFWGYAYRSLPYDMVAEMHDFKSQFANEAIDEMAKRHKRKRGRPKKNQGDNS